MGATRNEKCNREFGISAEGELMESCRAVSRYITVRSGPSLAHQ
jgi:hypothetical protein